MKGIHWLASFPKSGSTWARAFLANLLVPQEGRPLTLQEIALLPFFTDAGDKPIGRGFLGKAHRQYDPERHGVGTSVYIIRDPVDIVPSAANFFGTSPARMAKEVAKDWPRHVESWHDHSKLILKYEEFPDTFFLLAKVLKIDFMYAEYMQALAHSSFGQLQKDEKENGFSEASEKGGAFFRRGTPGGGREILTDRQVQNVIKGCGEWYERYYS